MHVISAVGSLTFALSWLSRSALLTQSKVRIGNYLSSSFPIENVLKQGDTLSPLLFNFAHEYAIRKVQETTVTWDWI